MDEPKKPINGAKAALILMGVVFMLGVLVGVAGTVVISAIVA